MCFLRVFMVNNLSRLKLFLRVLRVFVVNNLSRLKLFLHVFVVNKIDKQANLLNQILGYQADLGNFKLAQQGKNIDNALILNGCITLNNDRQGRINRFILL